MSKPILAARGDWPDYGLVPQFDHYWDLNNRLTDSPASGHTALNFSTVAAPTWGNDWAGRINQAITPADQYGLYNDTTNSDKDLGATFSIVIVFKTAAGGINGFPVMFWYSSDFSGWMIELASGSNGIRFHSGQGSHSEDLQSFAVTLSTSNSYHLGIVHESGVTSCYVNGSFIESKSQSDPASHNGALKRMQLDGYMSPNFATLYNAGILKGTALNATQIKYLYDTWVHGGGQVWKRHPYRPETAYWKTKLDARWPLGGVRPRYIYGAPPVTPKMPPSLLIPMPQGAF